MENDGLPPTNKTSLSESSSLKNIWTHTKINLLKARHVWTISNFRFFCEKPHQSMESKIFSAAGNENIKWKLQLGINLTHSGSFVSITLLLQNCENCESVKAKYRLIIYDDTMNERKVESRSHTFSTNIPSVTTDWQTQISHIVAAENKILSHGALTVGCEVTFLNNIDTSAGPGYEPEMTDSKSHCLNNLELMFKKQEISDVKINVGGRIFQAHKAILAAVSPVFLAMFKCNMTESERHSINIDDMDEETFEEMLNFIYTGTVDNLDNAAYTLFAAADKYAIDKLKHICEKQLYKSLTVENAVKILILADLHNSDWLKAQVIHFIKLQPIGVTKTEDFNSMIDLHRHLLAEIICSEIQR